MKKINKFFKWLFDYSTKDYIGLVIIIGFLLIAGWFYWFQWRPSEIRKQCNEVRREYAKENVTNNSNLSVNEAVKLVEWRYENCLHEKGLK